MDRTIEYRQIIERILHEHLEETPQRENVETVAIVDETREHFLLIDMGWQLPRRIYSVVFHVWLKDGKFHVEQDWTEYGVARQLLDAGIPPKDIALDFQPPNVRHLAQELMATRRDTITA
jgi:hypothetical protein